MFIGVILNLNYNAKTSELKWDSDIPSGICGFKAEESLRKKFVEDNHQYVMEINEDDTDVLMYLIQSDGRLYRGEKYPYS